MTLLHTTFFMTLLQYLFSIIYYELNKIFKLSCYHQNNNRKNINWQCTCCFNNCNINLLCINIASSVKTLHPGVVLSSSYTLPLVLHYYHEDLYYLYCFFILLALFYYISYIVLSYYSYTTTRLPC